MTTETPAADYDYAEAKRRANFIQALRDFADFLDKHPGVLVPSTTTPFNVFPATKEDLVKIAKLTSWKKAYTGPWFCLTKEFGTDELGGPLLTLEVNVHRETVCRKVVVGTRIVPAVEAQPAREEEVTDWVCSEPLLKGEQS